MTKPSLAADTWRARSLRAVWHPCTPMHLHARGELPLHAVARAEGVWLHGYDGARWLDGISSWWVNLFGHNHPAIRAALVDQLARLDHVMLAGFTHAPAVELAERLAMLSGLGHAFYASDGASAVEVALKMAAHHWRNRGRPAKCRFAALAGGYHGETLGALGVTDLALFRAPYEAMLVPAAMLPSPDARQPGGAQRAADALDAWLAAHHEETAALVVEPLLQCAGGMAMHEPAFLQRARAACDRHDVLLVADEIATGFGRTGSFFAHTQAGIRPDLLCLSKGLTGGTLPLACVLATDAVFNALNDGDDASASFLHSHSYSGNPLACRAALATLDVFEREDVLARNADTAHRLDAAFAPLHAHARVRHARRLGMVWAWDIEGAGEGFSRRYLHHALAHGVLLRPLGRTLYAMPPYMIDAAEGEHLARGAFAALEATLAETAS